MKNWYSHYLICLACPYKRRFPKVRWWMWPRGFRLVRQWWRLCCWNHRGFPGWVVSHKKLFAEIFYVLGQEELAEPETYYGYCAKLIRWHHLATKLMLPQTRLTKTGCLWKSRHPNLLSNIIGQSKNSQNCCSVVLLTPDPDWKEDGPGLEI